LENNLQTIKWTELQPQEPNYFFVPKDFAEQEEYDKGFSITELFPVNSSGIKTQRDDASICFTKEECEKINADFLNLTEEALKQKYGFENVRDWTISNAKNDLKTSKILADKIQYRPFDIRYALYTGKTKGIMGYPRYEVMQHFIKGENIGLISSRQFGGHEHFICFITNKIIEISSQPFAPYSVFPLYLYHDNFGTTEKVTNLNEKIVAEITRGFNPLSITPEHIFDYIYAVLHSPAYREKYKEFLKIDFPRIPYPQDSEYFNKMVAIGEKLRKLHLMENVVPQQNRANFPKSGSNTIEKPIYEATNTGACPRVRINDTQYFDNVPETAWNFYIGGYRPAQKWLKDRKGRTLTYEDIEHYQKIIFVLNETDKILNLV
jgi:predicted helicase